MGLVSNLAKPQVEVLRRVVLAVAEERARRSHLTPRPPGSARRRPVSDLNDVRDQLAGTEALVQDRLALERLTPDELSVLTASVEQAAKRLE